MNIGFICPTVPGHLNPMTALARHLQARNHDVVSLYSSGAAGLPFVPGPEKDHVNESIFEVSRMQGMTFWNLSVRLVLVQTETVNQRMTYRRSISYSVQRQKRIEFLRNI
jgi:UDP:flavonoid glycosyltransferase YjiC (YdhE family)